MKQYLDIVQKITVIINRSDLGSTETASLNNLIDKIRAKANDTNYYLAVIGEFSSGKTTLVNGFLRDDLLPTADEVTTASATKLVYGDRLGITAHFKKNYYLKLKPSIITHYIEQKKESLFRRIISKIYLIIGKFFGLPSKTSKEARYIQYDQPRNCNKKIITSYDLEEADIDIRSFIKRVIAEEDVAKDLDFIKIEHPSKLLQDGIVIIDLPGSNADNNRHLQVTKSVLENEADAAIVVIPSFRPLTKSLIVFLQSSISEYIDRCIFIITRLDEIPVKDQQKLIANITLRLSKLFQVSSDNIYTCSAKLALEQHTKKIIKEPDFDNWLKQFQEMETALVEKLQAERKKAIINNMNRLFDRLFQQLETNLNNRWQDYQGEKVKLEAELMLDFGAFSNEQTLIYQQEVNTIIDRTVNRVSTWLNSDTNTIYAQVKDSIFEADSWDNLKYLVEYKLTSILNQGKDNIVSKINDKCQPIQDELVKISEDFDRSFQKAYRRLSTLNGSVDLPQFVDQGTVTIHTTSILSSAQELNQKKVGNSLKGLFSHVFKGLLIERQREIWNLIRPNLDRQFQELERLVQMEITNYGKQSKLNINSRISYYVLVYQEQINQLLQAQKEELVKLEKIQKKTRIDLGEINSLKTSMISQYI